MRQEGRNKQRYNVSMEANLTWNLFAVHTQETSRTNVVTIDWSAWHYRRGVS